MIMLVAPQSDRTIRYDTIRYDTIGRLTCAQKLARWPA